MITIKTTINAPLEKVWKIWTDPAHIIYWNNASTDWYTPHAENDLRIGGRFKSRMEARDGSMGFDFEGQYEQVVHHKKIHYSLDDGRKVEVDFTDENGKTRVVESFDPENSNSEEMQQQGWQAILDNFKEYVESREKFSKIHFDIEINCPAKKVYDIMLDKENYEIWTKEFNAESTFEGSWKKGSEIRFIGIGEDGRKGGMLSRIRENIPGRFISMEHFGIIEGDNERTEGEDIEKWSGGREEYTFVEKDGITTLSVDTDTIPEFSGYFDESWPKALQKLKSLCEE